MARTNSLSSFSNPHTVEISIRGGGLLVTDDELDNFGEGESAFFGNVFAEQVEMYTCKQTDLFLNDAFWNYQYWSNGRAAPWDAEVPARKFRGFWSRGYCTPRDADGGFCSPDRTRVFSPLYTYLQDP
jgi:hypothetical protein